MIKVMRPEVFFSTAVLISFCVLLTPALSATAEQKGAAEELSLDVTDVKLAESIMMAAPYVFSYERDPFKPLAEVTNTDSAVSYVQPVLTEDAPSLHGIISSGGVNRALLQVKGKTKLYKAQEMAGAYLIESIDAKKVILKLGNNQLELKVGGDGKK